MLGRWRRRIGLLRHGWRAPAGVSSYALTGTAAGLRHGWAIPAGVASYALTGQPAAFVKAKYLNATVAASYALTGGVYSRSPENIRRVKQKFRVGNLYVNRKITGAQVNRQPFGGFKMSGIGSKAGGKPVGATGDPWAAQTRLLPYVERADLSQQIDYTQSSDGQAMAVNRVGLLICPAEVNDHPQASPTAP